MPTPTYTPLANLTLGSSAASVTFSSISQAYRDLVLVIDGSTTSSSYAPSFKFNADSGANYNYVFMEGSGSSAYSASSSGTTSGAFYYDGYTAQKKTIINIMDYSATDKHKTVLLRANASDAVVSASAQRWASTSAITSITLSASWASGSSFALYGIAA